MIEYPLHACVVPTWWKSIAFLHGFFRCEDFWRRRKAFRAFSPSSYAVMTNTELGLGSGTYMTRKYRPGLGLTEGDPCPVATGTILHRPCEDVLHFFLNDRVAIDVRLIRRRVDVEPNGHFEILRPVPCFRNIAAKI